ncbi:hypothetical protein [Niabella beijingensis]|uniref:hypothetical protein n=1 Tax=Niabella beijingensis TaxID=2872700 RepID=UPI001CC111A9|nr:hypothetical protein [Niabella beijingensis]MBZ4187604.1 hypothetical protein [Niabella beijingensis]
MRTKLKLSFDQLENEIEVIDSISELKNIVGGAAVDEIMGLLASKGFTFTAGPDGSYYGTAPGGSQDEFQLGANMDFNLDDNWWGWDYVYDGGSVGSGTGFDMSNEEGRTDCVPIALDYLMGSMINPLNQTLVPTSFAIGAYDQHHGTDNITNGVDAQNSLMDILDLAADMNGFATDTRAGTGYIMDLPDDTPEWTNVPFEGVGFFNTETGSHAVNITGYFKDDDGNWLIGYDDKQNNEVGLFMLASEMLAVTTLTPK